MCLLIGPMMTPIDAVAGSAWAFRQRHGLRVYDPPVWFLDGYFIARERTPGFVFGPVRDFVKTLGGTPAWLIEDQQLKRLEQAGPGGTPSEYSLYLEVVASARTEYWVFVVLPYHTAQEWFDARRAYHGRKAEGYYGDTRQKLDRAVKEDLVIRGELRFLIENGETSLQVPEEVIMDRFRPVFDLNTGRRLSPAAVTD